MISNQLLSRQYVELFHQVYEIPKVEGSPKAGTLLLNPLQGNVICNTHILFVGIHGCWPANILFICSSSCIIFGGCKHGKTELKKDLYLCPFKNFVFSGIYLAREGGLFHISFVNITPKSSIFTGRAL